MTLGVTPCDILIPRGNLEKFACVACDQFTGDASYWQKVDDLTKGVPSAYHVIFPEIYLGQDDAARTKTINETMEAYIKENVFTTIKNTVIFVERTLSSGVTRRGIVLAVDLEAYDFAPGTHSPVRPTEGTIADRLPPRVKIRENALLELPHIMILIDDPAKSVIEPLENAEKTLVYDTPLMLSGGSVRGWALSEPAIQTVLDHLGKLGVGEKDNVIRFAVGDGNHSLATAKRCWEAKKQHLTPEEQETDPARFALCEIVNVHDPALVFEPIHRVMYKIDRADLLAYLNARTAPDGHAVTLVADGKKTEIRLQKTHPLAVGTLQNLLDDYIKTVGGTVDYIHEPEQVEKNTFDPASMGFLLPAMAKSELFPAVLAGGVLPRKTFSMGMGIDKRYYLEARIIK